MATESNKTWKVVGITSMIVAALLIILTVAMQVLKNTIPTWDITSVSGGSAKIKFGRKEFSYTYGLTAAPLVLGNGRYSLVIQTAAAPDGTVLGVTGQLYDTESGSKKDSAKTVNVA